MTKKNPKNPKLTFAQSRATAANLQHDLSPGEFPTYDGPVHPHWQAMAAAKGFEITGRIRDRYHLALRCHACGETHASRVFTLTTAQPQCPSCQVSRLEREARAAGLSHLRRDPGDRHYSDYRLDCGHVIRRQHEIIRRMAAGGAGLRCETCHAAREAAEARERAWTLIGADPAGDPNYRLYHHGCGHVQRVARANMQTGRFDCAGCGQGWSASPSYLYVMRFTLATGRDLVKLGYARDPESRLTHQLLIDRRLPAEILRVVPIATGHAAIRIEKALHARLRRTYPEMAIDPDRYAGAINVRSEIYDADLTAVILDLLDGIAAEGAADPGSDADALDSAA